MVRGVGWGAVGWVRVMVWVWVVGEAVREYSGVEREERRWMVSVEGLRDVLAGC